MMNKILLAIVCFCLVNVTSLQASLVTSNLSESADTTEGISTLGGNNAIANSFTVPNTVPNHSLEFVTLGWGGGFGSAVLTVEIFSNNIGTGTPDTALTTLTPGGSITAPDNLVFSPIADVSLETGKTYWIVASVTGGSGSFGWTSTTSPNQTGWDIGNTALGSETGTGGTWDELDSKNALRFSVNAVPEPGSLALTTFAISMFAGSGYFIRRRRKRKSADEPLPEQQPT